MYGVIVSPQNLSAVKKALEGEVILQEHIGPFSAEDIRSVIQTVSLVVRQAIIVDLSCGPEDEVINGLSLFRQQKPHTRIIVLAVGRIPGDPALAAIADLGIEDIVAPDKGNSEKISHFITKQLNDTYKNADIWRVRTESPRTTEPEIAKYQDELSAKRITNPPDKKVERLIRSYSAGQSTIAIASAASGAGSSKVAIQAAVYLSQYFKNILVLELFDDQSIKQPALSAWTNQEDALFTVGNLKGIDFAYTTNANHILRLKKWDWVILDIGHMVYRDGRGGTIYSPHADELARATLGCVVSTGSVWGYEQLERFVQIFGDKRFDWNVLVNFSDQKQVNQITSDLKSYSWNGDLKVLRVPFNPSLYDVSEEDASMWSRLLDQFLVVEEQQGKTILEKLFKK